MPTDPIAIVEEFLDSPDIRVRKNAITALATIASRTDRAPLAEASIEKLVESAVDDKDPEIREWAAKEFEDLAETARDRVIQRLGDALRGDSHGDRAYTLLGVLKSQGATVRMSRIPMSLRFRFARSSNLLLDPTRAGKYRWNLSIPALLGGTLGLFLLFALLRLGLRGPAATIDNTLIMILLLGALAAAALSIAATRWANPISRQPDVGAVIVMELGGAMAASFLPLLIIAAISSLLGPDGEPTSGTPLRLLVTTIVVSGYVAATRFGTLVAYGIKIPRQEQSALQAARTARQSVTSRAVQAAVGAAAGILYLTVTALLLARYQGYPVPLVLWLVLMPSCFGLAYSYAAIDAAVPRSPRPFAGRAALPASGLLVAAMVAPALLLFAAKSREADEVLRGGNGSALTLGAADSIQRMVATTLPFIYEFAVKKGAAGELMLVTAAPGYSAEGRDLTIRVDGANGNFFKDDPPEIREKIREGTYHLRVEPYDAVNSLQPDSVLPLLVMRVLEGAGRSAASAAPGGVTPFHVELGVFVDSVRYARYVEVSDLLNESYYADSAQVRLRADSLRKVPAGVIRPWQYNRLCFYGISVGLPYADPAMFGCDRAVDMDPMNPLYRDTRGIARGIAGEITGALDDLRAAGTSEVGLLTVAKRDSLVLHLGRQQLTLADVNGVTLVGSGVSLAGALPVDLEYPDTMIVSAETNGDADL